MEIQGKEDGAWQTGEFPACPSSLGRCQEERKELAPLEKGVYSYLLTREVGPGTHIGEEGMWGADPDTVGCPGCC